MLMCTARTLWCLNITPSDPTPTGTEFLVHWTLFSSNSWVLVVGVFHSCSSVIMSPSSRDLEALSHAAVEEENTFTIILVISFTIFPKVLLFYRNCFSGEFWGFSHCSWKWVICPFLPFSLYLSIHFDIYFSMHL